MVVQEVSKGYLGLQVNQVRRATAETEIRDSPEDPEIKDSRVRLELRVSATPSATGTVTAARVRWWTIGLACKLETATKDQRLEWQHRPENSFYSFSLGCNL